ncbi:Trans-enoyl reductase tndF [Exophiala dermatitidis]
MTEPVPPHRHLAAILPQKGGPLSIVERITPEPGPGEILIEIKAVALNPVDYYQRDLGIPPVPVYPAVLGNDASGIVAKVGSNVDTSDSTTPELGNRVIALASSFVRNGNPDYGAFQQYALVQSEAVIPLPDHLSFEQGAVFSLAVMTALTAWTCIGISLDTKYSPEDKQGVLIWGAASSVGTFAVQSARLLGFGRIYATASSKHHDYLKRLGADAVFDYHDSDVVDKIVDAVRRDGARLNIAHCVVIGGLQPTLDVLKETKGEKVAKVAHSPPLPEDHPTLDDTEIVFNFPSLDKKVRDAHMYRCFHGWLYNALKERTVVPSPRIQVERGGLDGLNGALDKLREGVSGTKIVVPI